jgi:hypothetical protein
VTALRTIVLSGTENKLARQENRDIASINVFLGTSKLLKHRLSGQLLSAQGLVVEVDSAHVLSASLAATVYQLERQEDRNLHHERQLQPV